MVTPSRGMCLCHTSLLLRITAVSTTPSTLSMGQTQRTTTCTARRDLPMDAVKPVRPTMTTLEQRRKRAWALHHMSSIAYVHLSTQWAAAAPLQSSQRLRSGMCLPAWKPCCARPFSETLGMRAVIHRQLAHCKPGLSSLAHVCRVQTMSSLMKRRKRTQAIRSM